MYYKVKIDNKIATRCVYNILGINVEGRKEILEAVN
jgi:transposase-like protein